MTDDNRTAESWLSRNGWVLAAVWLVFLIFPLFSILGSDDIGRSAKIGGTVLMAAYAVVYIHGFQRQFLAGLRSDEHGRPARAEYTGRGHIALLVALAVAVYVAVGAAGLGVVPFIVAFAVFHFSWMAAWFTLIAATAVTLLVPLATDAFSDVWFLTLIVGSVGAASMLIRTMETTESERAVLHTQLAVSGERNRVARDVHDVLGHSLTAVILKAELCEKLIADVDPDDPDDRQRVAACRDQLAELRGISRGALAEIRSTVGGLRAVNLADEVTVARTVLADAGVGLTVTGEIADVPEEHRPLLAWVVREAVTNVVRHASAEQCRIELAAPRVSGDVVLRIADDGVGFAADRPRDVIVGNGLRGVRERIDAAGGELTLRSGAGTIVEVAL